MPQTPVTPGGGQPVRPPVQITPSPTPQPPQSAWVDPRSLIPQGEPYAGFSQAQLNDWRDYEGQQATDPVDMRWQEREIDPFAGLSSIERGILGTIAGVSQTVSDLTQPLRESEIWQAAGSSPLFGLLGRGIMGALNALDAGAEYIVERGTGLFRQYAMAKQDGTTDDFWRNFNRNWRASHFTYEAYGSLGAYWDDARRQYTFGVPGMPGDVEMRRIQQYVTQGMSTEQISQQMMTDMGSMYYRGMLQDALGHIVLDPINFLLGAVKPIDSISRIGVEAGWLRPTAEFLEAGQDALTANRAERALIIASSSYAQELEDVNRAMAAATTAERVVLEARRTELVDRLGQQGSRLEILLQQEADLLMSVSANPPSRVQQFAMRMVQATPPAVVRPVSETEADIARIETEIASLEEDVIRQAERAAELDREVDLAASEQEFVAASREAEAFRATLTEMPPAQRALQLRQDLAGLHMDLSLGQEAARLRQVINEGARLWKPWTWFRLRPEAVGVELQTRLADGLRVLFNNAATEEELRSIVRTANNFIRDPRLGLSIFTPAGRTLSAGLQASESVLMDLIDGYVANAGERGALQQIATVLAQAVPGAKPSRVLGRLAEADVPRLLEDLARGLRTMPADSEAAEVVGRLLALGREGATAECARLWDVFMNGAGDIGRPFDLESLKLFAIGRVNETVARMGIVQFGVRAEDWLDRATNVVKAGESLLYLRLNPGYPLRNFLNNELTLWARGVWTTMGTEAIGDYWKVMGYSPERLGEGFGIATENEIWQQISGVTTREGRTLVRDALRGERGLLNRAQDFISSRRVLRRDMSSVASFFESSASARAFTMGHMQFMASYWRPGIGFDGAAEWLDRFYPGATETLGPNFLRQLESGVVSARNRAQLLERAFSPQVFSINDAVDVVAQRMGRASEEVRDILGEPFMLRLEQGLTEAYAGDPAMIADKVDALYTSLSEGIQSHLDEMHLNVLDGMADRAASVLKATGDPTGLVQLGSEQADDIFEFMTGGITNTGERAEAIRQLPLDEQPAAWERLFTEDHVYYGRMLDRLDARYNGIVRAANRYGVNVPNESLRPLSGYRTAVETFFRKKSAALRAMRDGDMTWAEVSGLLDREYTGLMQATRRFGEATDAFLFRTIAASDRSAMMPAARAWRGTVNELRDLYMVETRRMYRTVTEAVDDAARQAAYTEFRARRLWWQEQIHIAEREGAAMIRDGRSFGSHVDLDDTIARIFADRMGPGRQGISLDERMAAIEGLPPNIARRQALAEIQREGQSITTRVGERMLASGRLDGQAATEVINANEVLTRGVGVGAQGDLNSAQMGVRVRAAVNEISDHSRRIQWLEALLDESDPVLRPSVIETLHTQWAYTDEFTLPELIQNRRYAIVSWERAGMTDAERAAARQRFLDELERSGWKPIESGGGWLNDRGVLETESSALIPGMGDREAMRMGQFAEQQSVIVSPIRAGEYARPGGYLHTTGERLGFLDPLNFDGIVTNAGADLGYTRIATIGGRGPDFTFHLPQYAEGLRDPSTGLYLLHQSRPWVAPLDGPDGYVVLDTYRAQGLTRLDPFDARCLTGQEGAEQWRRLGDDTYLHNLQYYIGDTPPEDQFVRGLASGRYRHYQVRVERSAIYDLARDPEHVLDFAGGDINLAEQRIHDLGFVGYRNPLSDNPNTVKIFEPLDPIGEGAHITTHSIRPGNLYTQRSWTFARLHEELIAKAGADEATANVVTSIAEARARFWASQVPGRTPEQYLAARAFRGIDTGMTATMREEHMLGGMRSTMEDGGQLITIFRRGRGNAWVITHEFAHFFLDDLETAERVRILGVMGFEGSTWTVAAHEAWADGFTRYLLRGELINPQLQVPFETFKDYIAALYRSTREGWGVNWAQDWDPEFREVMERFLGSDVPRDIGANGTPGLSFERFMMMAPDEVPAGRALDELWWTDGRQLMEAFRNEIDSQRATRTIIGMPEDPYVNRAIGAYLDHVTGQLGDTSYAAMRYGEIKRDAGLLNYHRRTYFDHYLGHVAPFAFWTTHTAWNWLLWSPDKPWMIADFMRMRNLAVNMQGNMPTRFRGSLRIPLASIPGIPDWLGPIYVNPFRIALPFDMWINPFEQVEQEGRSAIERARVLLEQQRDAGTITSEDYNTAITTRNTELWTQALQQAQQSAGEGTDGFDLMQQLISPHAPLIWAWHVARGTTDKIGPFLPITRTIRSLTAILGWPGGGLNIEGGLRRTLGLPAFDRWDDYRGERMVSNMISDGTVPVRDGLLAMQQHSGPIWEEAVSRAAREYAVMTFSGTIGVPMRAYPPGEEQSRELMGMMNEAYRAQDAGDTEAVNRFWQEHPEVAGRLALFNTPEERLNRFLTDEIWDRWQGLTSLERRSLTQVLGTDFEYNFVDSATRNPEAIPSETLAVWLKLMGGSPPGTMAASTLPAALPPAEISQRAETFYRERAARFSAVFPLQDQYFAIQEGPERTRFVQSHPILRQYWDWRRDWLLRNPDVMPYLVEDETQRPQYETAAEAGAAAAAQPSFTWEEYGTVMQQDAYRLVGDRFRQRRAISGDLLTEIENLAEQMGTTSDRLISDMRRAWTATQGP